MSCTAANGGDSTAEGLRSLISAASEVHWSAHAVIEAFVSFDHLSCRGSPSRERNRREREKDCTRRRNGGWVRKRERWAEERDRGASEGLPEVAGVLAVNYRGGC